MVFGPDRDALHGLDLAANSTVVVPLDPPALAERLARVVDYWANVNEANVGA